MARGNNETRWTKPTRELRKESGRTTAKTHPKSLIYLAALTYAAGIARTGVYIAAPTVHGDIRIKLYTPDEAIQTTLAFDDSPEDVLGELISEACGEVAEEIMHKRAAAWLAETASETPKTAKPRRGSGDDPTAPLEAAQ